MSQNNFKEVLKDIKIMATTGCGMSALVKIHLLKEFRYNRIDIEIKRERFSFPYPTYPEGEHRYTGINWQASPLYDGCRTMSLSGDPNPRNGKFPVPSLIWKDK